MSLKKTLSPASADTPTEQAFNVTAVVGIVWAVLTHFGYVSGPVPTP
jgi:hypothetical protein